LLIASGASTTSLLRAPVGNPGLGPSMLTSHMALGAALGLIIAVRLLVTRQTRLVWPVVPIAATLALGWFARRTFAPLTAAEHAAIAASTIVALLPAADATSSAGANRPSPRRWKTSVAHVGFVLLLVQIALGALVRHQLMPVVWHVLIGGLAAVAILVPAVAITQEPSAARDERLAARWVIASVLVQVSLGVTALFMIMIGSPTPLLWVATTVSHVVAGSVTLLAAARLTRVLRPHDKPSVHAVP
jgi:hypothetical protein